MLQQVSDCGEVFKKTYIVCCCFYTQYFSKLIVHFYRYRPHTVSYAAAFNTDFVIIAHFTLITFIEFTTRESCNIFGFDAMYGCGNHLAVDLLQIVLLFKYNIGSIFGLQDTPMVPEVKILIYRAKLPCKLI